jgi:hypothetical protein
MRFLEYPPMQQRKKDTHYANEQSIRFVEAAKKTGADQSGKTFEKSFKKIVKAEKPPAKK